MAYVCDAHQIVSARPATPHQAGILETLASAPRRALAWLSAWSDAADEASIGRDFFLRSGGKLTDGMERELMRRVMNSNWNQRD